MEEIWSYTVDHDGPTRTVLLAGDFDMSVAAALLTVLTAQIGESGITAVCADLAAVSFLDSAGLRALIQAKDEAERVGCTFTVTGAKGRVLEILDLTGLTTFLTGNSR